MVSSVVAIALAAAIGAAFLFAVIRAYRTLASVEFIALWWWAAITVFAFAGIAGHVRLLSGIAGFLMLGLGSFLATNTRGIADRLARRRMGIGSAWAQYSTSYWRFSGAFLAIVGAFWTLAFGSSV
jgi:hypothetical protein